MTIRKITVIGMGYVGIPSALVFANTPIYDKVWGLQRPSDRSVRKISQLNKGENPLVGEHELDPYLKQAVASGKFECTTQNDIIAECDAVIISVQTPFEHTECGLSPDYSHVITALNDVIDYLQPGSLVSIESTITPGSTDGWIKEILNNGLGMYAGEHYHIVHAPERIMSGSLIKNIQTLDRVVGGVTPECTDVGVAFYKPVMTTGRVIPMTATEAEITKTSENAIRDVQIAIANQISLYCEAMGANFFNVAAGVRSLKGYGISRCLLSPGAGVGGHCLPKDGLHLERGYINSSVGYRDFPSDIQSLFILSRMINDYMPDHMFNLTVHALLELKTEIKDLKIAMLGWSFLGNSSDTRNTPSRDYYQKIVDSAALLNCEKIRISIHDPYAAGDGDIAINSNLDTCIRDSDVIVILTAHDEYKTLDPEHVKKLTGKQHPIIIDGRNIIQPEKFIRNDFIYRGIGRGDLNFKLVKDFNGDFFAKNSNNTNND